MNEYTLYDKIEAYLKGAMSLDEIKKFEQDINQNPKLAKMVQMHRFEWDAMEVIVENDLRGKMAMWQGQTEQPPSVKESEKSPFLSIFVNRRFYYGLAAAASVTLLIATAMWFFKEKEKMNTDIVKSNQPTDNRSPQDTAVVAPPQYLPTLKQQQTEERTKIVESPKKQVKKDIEPLIPQNSSSETALETDNKAYIAFAETAYKESGVLSYDVTRGTRGNNTAENALDEAGQAYDKKAYDKVIGLLANTAVKDENFSALTILAHAYFQNKNYKAALPAFQNVLKLSGKTSQNKSEWFLLLCYLANYGQYRGDFKVLAEQILANKDHSFFNETVLLLKEVNGK